MLQSTCPGRGSSPAPPLGESKARILIVASDDERKSALQRIAARNGHDTLCPEDPNEVFRLVAEYEPDLILLDICLPEGCGLEICGELRAMDVQANMPIILLGLEQDTETQVAHGLLAGADDYVRVVSHERELHARIQVQLRNKRYRDALQRVRSERERFRRDAEHDPLTGLLNRRSLERHVDRMTSSGERFALLFVDIDHFKRINDEFGHEAGDEVLRTVAERMRDGIRPGDFLGRYGGEEFLILVTGAGRESARLVAERQRKHIETMPVPHARLSKLTVSIGAAAFDPSDQEEGTEHLLRRADLALYRAKHAGRNRVVMATDAEAETGAEPGVMRSQSGMRQAHRTSSRAPMAKGAGR